ncbi:MAG: hypothetical protein JWP61_2083 [Friedmanniella sp.]|nr:hypothetical protein [Friedmanniella sp.]
MALLLLTSTSGSPGVTTTAVGLALSWPRPVLLVDTDPGAHQSVLAGYLGGRSAQGKGLIRIAEAHRDRRYLPEVVLDQSLPLTDAGDVQRLFLPGFTRAGSASHFAAVWEDLAAAFDRLGDLGFDVLVDCGRLTASGLPSPLLEHASLTCLLLRSQLRSVMSARVHLTALRAQLPGSAGSSDSLGLVVVGPGQPYGAPEISRSLGVPPVAELAWDPSSAEHLSDGRPRARKFDQSPLVRSLRSAASSLAASLEHSRNLVQTP